MDGTVFIVTIQFLPIDNLVTAFRLLGEFDSLARNINGVVRMDIAIHIGIEDTHHIFPGCAGRKPMDQALRNKDCPNATIHKLIHRKGNLGGFQFPTQHLGKSTRILLQHDCTLHESNSLY